MRRRFNTQERAVLYIAAGGHCENCGDELQPGWHSDHKHPYSKGGATDVINGSALCPTCNLRKGSKTIMTDLRPWQQEALDHYLSADKRDYLAVACPGSGKTTWALTVARTLLDRGAIGRVVVIVPSDALRIQWADHNTSGVDLRPFTGTESVDKEGYHGIVTTYQALGGVSAHLIRRAIGDHDPKRTLVILDEIHHAADNSSYGKALDFAFENAIRRLSLTGTPWRTDARERMPFVTFGENGMLEVDYSYNYGRAVRDGACRRIDFPIVDAHAAWVRDLEKKEEAVTVNRRLRGSDRSDALRTLLDASPTGKWLADVIMRAHRDLLSMRVEIPDAGGLIVAKDRSHAKKIARLLKSITGVSAPVVVSAEDEGGANVGARQAIERFRSSRDPWIIAVKMIAEGVDIPRLMVGVYATNVSTSMFFNQAVGRFVRIRPNEAVTSRMYVPPSFALWAIVQEIQRMLPQRLEESPGERERKREGAGGSLNESHYAALSSDANGLSVVRTFDGDVQGSLVGEWVGFFGTKGIPTHYATQAASSGATPPSSVSVLEAPLPVYREEEALRKEINSLAGRVANYCYGDYTAGKEVYRDLWRRFGMSVTDMPIATLREAKELLLQSFETGDRVA